MNRQIDDMAITLCEDYGKCNKCALSNPEFENPCMIKEDCERLYNQGYRKASDVAHEIFAWIEEHMYNANFVRGTVEIDFCSYLAFKKKYESEGGE